MNMAMRRSVRVAILHYLKDIEDHTSAEGYGLLDVWMSHGDHVDILPPGFKLMASTESRSNRWYGR